MFSHILVGTNNIDDAKEFYDKVLGVLGVGQGIVQPNATGHKRVFLHARRQYIWCLRTY